MPTLRRVVWLEGGGYRVVQPDDDALVSPDVVVSQDVTVGATDRDASGPALVGPAGGLSTPNRTGTSSTAASRREHPDADMNANNKSGREGGARTCSGNKQNQPAQGTSYRRQNNKLWNERFEQLKQYKVDHGDCNVPQGWKGNIQLGRWVSSQRSEYHVLKKGRPSRMTEERLRKLEGIGFQWSLRSGTGTPHADWDQRFNELKQYKVDHGDCNVPRGWKGNKQLGHWVGTQRSEYHSLKRGQPSSMVEERIGKLESIGFQWRLRSRTCSGLAPSCSERRNGRPYWWW